MKNYHPGLKMAFLRTIYSGGPLVLWNPQTKKRVLIGIVSWGVNCADNRYPGVYARDSDPSHATQR